MKRRFGWFDVVAYAMGLFFVYAAVVQYNDPDPYVWVPIYGTGVAFAVLYVLRVKRVAWAGVLLAGAAIAFGATYVPEVVSRQLSLVESEQGREMLGLFIVGAWLGVAGWMLRRGGDPASER